MKPFTIIIQPHEKLWDGLLPSRRSLLGFMPAKSILKKQGLYKRPQDLNHHRLIGFVSDEKNLFVSVENLLHTNSSQKRTFSVLTDSSIGEARLVNNGAGIGCISPKSQNINLENLIHIDIGVPDIEVTIYYYYKKNAYKLNPLILKFYETIIRNILIINRLFVNNIT